MPSPQELLEALRCIKYPGFSRDIVDFGIVKDIEVGGARVTEFLTPSTDKAEVVSQIRQQVIATLASLVQVSVEVVVERPSP
ncbi:MAG: iron-sulfur cluster assembly protein, partial [Candidatus Binatia bacterium]